MCGPDTATGTTLMAFIGTATLRGSVLAWAGAAGEASREQAVMAAMPMAAMRKRFIRDGSCAVRFVSERQLVPRGGRTAASACPALHTANAVPNESSDSLRVFEIRLAQRIPPRDQTEPKPTGRAFSWPRSR